jgi:hypothetical protein
MWSAHHGQQGGEWKSPIGKNAGGGGEKKGLLDWNLHDSIWLSKDKHKHMCYDPLNIHTYMQQAYNFLINFIFVYICVNVSA